MRNTVFLRAMMAEKNTQIVGIIQKHCMPRETVLRWRGGGHDVEEEDDTLNTRNPPSRSSGRGYSGERHGVFKHSNGDATSALVQPVLLAEPAKICRCVH